MQVFNINDSYFKYLKCTSGITYQYVNQLEDIYEKNLMVGTNYCIYCMYNEFDIINNFMVNLKQVDVCSTTNLDISKKYFTIDDVPLKTNHRVILVGQDNTIENNIYNVDSRGYLSVSTDLIDSGTTWRYKSYVKLGTNKGKQFHLRNVGNRFPLSGEKKTFLDGHGYIIKNLFNYNLFNIGENEDIIPKLIFTDYEMARISVDRDRIINGNGYVDNLWTGFDVPDIFEGGSVGIKYHENQYTIDVVGETGSTYSYSGYTDGIGLSYKYYDINEINKGIFYPTSGYTTREIINVNDKYNGSETWVAVETALFLFHSNSAPYIQDYIKFELTGSTSLFLKSFIKRTQPTDSGMTWIILTDYIPDEILGGLYYDTYTITNLMYTKKSTLKDVLSDSFFSYYFTIVDTDGKLFVKPIEYKYNKYFDYDGLSFVFNPNSSRLRGVINGRNFDASTSGYTYVTISNGIVSYIGAMNGMINADPFGEYLVDLKAGTYTVTYSETSGLYAPMVTGLTLLSDGNLVMMITLDHYLGIVSGTCTDLVNGVPVSGVTITIGNLTGVTNSSGEYIIVDILSGNVLVEYANFNYTSGSVGALVPNGGTIEVNFSLYPTSSYQTGSLSGITTDIDDNTLNGVNVSISMIGMSTTTAGSGTYLLENIPINSFSPNHPYYDYNVMFSKYGYVTEYRLARVRYQQLTGSTDAQLDYVKCSIYGVFTDSDTGEFIVGASVLLTGTTFLPTNYTGSTSTDSNGYYEFNDLYLGSYQMSYTATDYNSGITYLLGITGNINQSIQMTHEKGTLDGLVTEIVSMDPIEDALISVTDGPLTLTTLSDGGGFYQIVNIRTGYRPATCSALNYSTVTSGATIVANTTTTLNFELEPVVNIYGYTSISNLTGNPPLSYVTLVLSGVTNGVTATTTSNDIGYYVFNEVPSSNDYNITYSRPTVNNCYVSGITSNFSVLLVDYNENILVQKNIPEPIDTIVGSGTTCQSTYGVTYSITGMTLATGYVWSVPTGCVIVSGNNTTGITVDFGISAVSGNITVYGTNVCGSGNMLTLPVTVNVRPVPTITTYGITTFCQNSTYWLGTEAGMTNYIWGLDGATVITGSGTNMINVKWSTTGSKTLTVSYTSPNGCNPLAPATLITSPVVQTPDIATAINGPNSTTVNTNTPYSATGTFGTTIVWGISSGGIIVSGQGTASVVVKWTTTGIGKEISVYSYYSTSCMSPTFHKTTISVT